MRVTEKELKNIPLSPGVYLFKDKSGGVIYVGKSARLRARVRSYFQQGTRLHNAAHRKLMEKMCSVEIIETNSEIEALVKEAGLIKRLKPKFNRLLRDSKNYGYVAITKEDWPRITVTHQPSDEANKLRSYKPQAEFIGPFTDMRALYQTLQLLRRIFPYFTSRRVRKLDVQLELAPDKEKIDKTSYRRNIAQIKRILNGRSTVVAGGLKRKIASASRKEKFEEARELKKQYESLQRVMEHAHVLSEERVLIPSIFRDVSPNFRLLGLKEDPARIEAYDVSNIHGKEAVGSMVVFTRHTGRSYAPDKSEYKKFRIKTVRGSNDVAMMREVISRRLAHDEWPAPGLIVVDGGRTQLNATLRALGGKNIPIIALAKKKEEIYFPNRAAPVRAQNFGASMLNLLTAIRNESHRFAISYHRLLKRKTLSQ